MNRRDFLVASGASMTAAMAVAAEASAASFQSVDFIHDGLGLSPTEYVELMRQRETAADYYSNGGIIEEIERTFAALLGKESAVFLPTGTLANHVALRKLARGDRRILIQAESHIYNDSGDCAETLSGLNLVPLAESRTTFTLSEVAQWLDRTAAGRVEGHVGVISIESPVRRKDHEMFDFAEMTRICAQARERGIRLHLDGARMFNLPHHSGRTLKDHAALFDTVYVSLWKHFNGTAGAILAGDKRELDGLFHTRRMFGGSLPYAWPTVALVPQYAGTYQDDYAKAWQIADALFAKLEASGHFKIRKLPNGTSKVFLTVKGIEPAAFFEHMAKRSIAISRPAAGAKEIALQINATLLRTTPDALADQFLESARA